MSISSRHLSAQLKFWKKLPDLLSSFLVQPLHFPSVSLCPSTFPWLQPCFSCLDLHSYLPSNYYYCRFHFFRWLFSHLITFFCLFFKINYLFIYFWLCWVFVSLRGLSPVAAGGGHSSSRCVGLSLSRPLLLWSTGSRRAGSVAVAHRPSCSAACGIFPDQGSNPCPLHWQADSQPLRHQGSPSSIKLTASSLVQLWSHQKAPSTFLYNKGLEVSFGW